MTLSMSLMRQTLGKALVLATAALIVSSCGSQPTSDPATNTDSGASSSGTSVTLNGAGASFPAPLYERYALEFKKTNPDIQVNYQAIGSGGGIKQTIAGTTDFGGSDAAMKDEEIAQVDRGIILVPTAGGAVSVIYNLEGVSDLKLSREILPAIFSGEITKWNDPKIAAANPGVDLPDSTIRSVVRSDGSGTSFIFSNHLSAISESFKSNVGTDKAPNWPTGVIKSRGNAGIAQTVSKTPGAIGYVEYSYAKENDIPAALVENQTGEFVAPSEESANKALETVQFPDNYRVFVEDPDAGYPIVGLTWMMVYKNYPDGKAEPIKKWIEWVLTDGQELNGSLSYTRIPQEIAQKVINEVNTTVQ